MSQTKLLTTKEMADILRVSTKMFRKYVREYELTYYGSSRCMRFKESEVLEKLKHVGRTLKLNNPKLKAKSPKAFAKNNKYAKMLGLNG